jgi:hypothetical protein
LSDILHKAEADEDLFLSQLKDVELHFEGAAVLAKARRE